MWDKTKGYKNNRTVKRGYDLMFENFFFLLSFSCVKITFQFQPIGVIFPSFSCVRLKVPVHGNLGGVRGGRCPLSPPSGSATAMGYGELHFHKTSGPQNDLVLL